MTDREYIEALEARLDKLERLDFRRRTAMEMLRGALCAPGATALLEVLLVCLGGAPNLFPSSWLRDDEAGVWRMDVGPLQLLVFEPDEAGERFPWRVTAACGCCGYEREGKAEDLSTAQRAATRNAWAWLVQGLHALEGLAS